jgi:hypothetical protein
MKAMEFSFKSREKIPAELSPDVVKRLSVPTVTGRRALLGLNRIPYSPRVLAGFPARGRAG